jgi:hypothetical protein
MITIFLHLPMDDSHFGYNKILKKNISLDVQAKKKWGLHLNRKSTNEN